MKAKKITMRKTIFQITYFSITILIFSKSFQTDTISRSSKNKKLPLPSNLTQIEKSQIPSSQLQIKQKSKTINDTNKSVPKDSKVSNFAVPNSKKVQKTTNSKQKKTQNSSQKTQKSQQKKKTLTLEEKKSKFPLNITKPVTMKKKQKQIIHSQLIPIEQTFISPFQFLTNFFNMISLQGQKMMGKNNGNLIYDLETTGKKEQIVELNKEVTFIPNKTILVQIPQTFEKDQYMIFNLNGQGNLHLDIVDGSPQRQKLFEFGFISLFQFGLSVIVPVELNFLQSFKGKFFRLRLKSILFSLKMKMTVEKKNFFEAKVKEPLKIFSKFLHHIPIKLNFTKIDKITEKSRIQFILKTRLSSENFLPNQSLSMLINKDTDFPTRENHQMNASGNIGTGLIKTINSQNQYFCNEENCTYFFKINVVEIDEVTFFASIFDNHSKIKFQNNMTLLEELSPLEKVTYELDLEEEGDEKFNWMFTIIPFENSPQIFINPDFEPKTLQDYKYYSLRQESQEIFISASEQTKFGFKENKFFVTFNSINKSQSTTFSFQLNKVPNEELRYIKENYTIGGVIANEEIINFKLDLFTGEPQVFNLDFFLLTKLGNVNIFIKECSLEKKNKCLITNDDIQNKKTLTNNKHKIFKFSTKTEPLKKSQQTSLHLNTNCLGNDPLEEVQDFKNNYRKSMSCQFVVGLQGYNSKNNYGMFYSLSVKGNDVLFKRIIGENFVTKIQKGAKKYFEFPVSKKLLEKSNVVIIQIIQIEGFCEIYFSETNRKPSPQDNAKKIILKSQDITSLHTKSFEQIVKLKNQNKRRVKTGFYMSVIGTGDCMLDFYTDLLTKDDIASKKGKVEKLTFERNVYRHIQRRNQFKSDNKTVFFKNFNFSMNSQIIKEDYFEIHLNSDIQELKLCVFANIEEFDIEKTCDYETFTNNLKILKNEELFQNNIHFILSVQKIKKDSDLFVQFPIEFSVLLHSPNSNQKIELIKPNENLEYALESKNSMIFKLEMQKIVDKAMILFTSHSIFVKADLKINLNPKTPSIFQLNTYNFASSIENARNFKQKYCQTKSCVLYLKVQNDDVQKQRFSLCLHWNYSPISLKEGQKLKIPNNQRLYFGTHPKNSEILSFTYANSLTKAEVYSKMVELETLKGISDYDLFFMLNENNFEYKSKKNQSGQILYNLDDYNKFRNPVVLYLFIPKFDSVKERKEDFALYGALNTTFLSIHSNVENLTPYYEKSEEVEKGDFKYFHLFLDQPTNFTLILTVQSGRANLFISKGSRNFPSVDNFWLKDDKEADKIITVDKKDQNNTRIFTVGVFGVESSKFSLLFVNGFDNVLRIEFQKVLNATLKKQQFYYFDFTQIQTRFSSLLYASQSDVEVSLLMYDEFFGENLLSAAKNEFSVVKNFILKQNEPPKRELIPNQFSIDDHYVLRLRAIDDDAKVDIAIFDTKQPLLIPFKKEFYFAQDKNNHQVFKVFLNDDYDRGDIQMILDFGSIEFAVSENQYEFDNFVSLDSPGRKIFSFKDLKHRKKRNDVIIFRVLYIKVKSSDFSKFTILVKPIDKYIEIKPFESKIVKSDSDNDLFVYFTIKKKQLKKIKQFHFTLRYQKRFYKDYELLFISDQDIELNPDTPFLPMNVKKRTNKYIDGFIFEEIQPALVSGYFVLKFPKSYQSNMVMVQVLLNNIKELPLNGVYESEIDANDKDKYVVFTQKLGQINVTLESCQDKVAFGNFVFDDYKNQKKLTLKQHEKEKFSFISINSIGNNMNPKKSQMNYQPLAQSYQTTSEGIFKFTVLNSNKKEKIPYSLRTDFVQNNQNVRLENYLEYQKSSQFIARTLFQKDKGSIKLYFKTPIFKSQLLTDFPKLKYVKVIFQIYLNGNENFEKLFLSCGFASFNSKLPQNILIYNNSVEKIYSLSQLKSNDTLEINFNKEIVKMTSIYPKLSIFNVMSVVFLENENEKFLLINMPTFFEIPYFSLKMQNEFYSYVSFGIYSVYSSRIFRFFMFLILILLIILGYFVMKVCFRQIQSKKNLYVSVEKMKNNYVQSQYFEKEEENQDIEMIDVDEAERQVLKNNQIEI